jgi:hypothetical protein
MLNYDLKKNVINILDKRCKIAFSLLVLVQGLHSVEEYIGKLWEVFPPARLLTSLVSQNLEIGFLIINIGLFFFGVWCWLFAVLKDYIFARGLVWFWIVIEMINGIGHPLWALYEREYVPGVASAIILLMLSTYLARNLLLINRNTND